MARTEKFTTAQVIEAIAKGITPKGAAEALHCDPDTIRNYAKRHPTVKAALESKREDLVDLAEMGLRGALLGGQAWAVAFTLRTLGRSRGYVERQEHEVSGAGGGPIETVTHVKLTELTDEELNTLAAIARRSSRD